MKCYERGATKHKRVVDARAGKIAIVSIVSKSQNSFLTSNTLLLESYDREREQLSHEVELHPLVFFHVAVAGRVLEIEMPSHPERT